MGKLEILGGIERRRRWRLFDIERAIHGQNPECRAEVRRDRSLPELDALKTFLETAQRRLPGRGETAKAIRYALSRWPALMRFRAGRR